MILASHKSTGRDRLGGQGHSDGLSEKLALATSKHEIGQHGMTGWDCICS